MPETKTTILEREYIIPLRRAWMKTSNYRRTGRAIRAIKLFIAKHMKVEDRDLDKVKLDMYFNNEIWFRGRRNPPHKIKVRAVKEDGIVRVYLAEVPDQVKFLKQKHEKRHKVSAPKEKPKAEEKKEEKTEEEKKVEGEKEKSAAEQKEKFAEQQTKAQKHTTKVKESTFHRMALKK